MIGYFLIIDKCFRRAEFCSCERQRQLPVRTDSAGLEPLFQRADHVGCQIPGVGSRVGQDFVRFVETLHDV